MHEWTPMVPVWEPAKGSVVREEGLNLVDPERPVEGGAATHVVTHRGSEQTQSEWVARLDGIGDGWTLARTFLRGRPEASPQRVRYILGAEAVGLYEACSVLARVGTRRVYFAYTEARCFEVMTEEAMWRQLRQRHAVGFGEVRSLAARHQWGLARRCARWLPRRAERRAARAYIEGERARCERELKQLRGEDAELFVAEHVRRVARKALAVHVVEQGIPAPMARACEVWLLGHTDAEFWVGHRAALEQGEAIWEMFLRQEIRGEIGAIESTPSR